MSAPQHITPAASVAENPPAFPFAAEYGHPAACGGMSLRDYFAVHADQPGASELVAEAGLIWSALKVWRRDDPDNAIGTFDQWWSSLLLVERYALYAKVRYTIADAMLAARAVQS